jgi:hypothetical protein
MIHRDVEALTAREELGEHANGRSVRALLVHGGEAAGRRQGIELVPWGKIDGIAMGD